MSPTTANGNLSKTATFFRPGRQKNPYIHTR